MKTRQEIFDLIRAERQRQNEKWGPQNHYKQWWFVILSEEIGEVAKAIYEHDEDEYELELIQSASVLVAMLEDFYNGRTLDEDEVVSDRESSESKGH